MDISSSYQKQNLNDQFDILNPSYEESLQSQDIYFPSQKVLITLLIIFLIFVLLLEKIFISLFLLIIPSYILLILTMIAIHIYLLRCVVYLCAYPGKNYFVQFYLRYIRSKTIGQIIRNKLKIVLDSLNKLLKLAKDNSELNSKKLEEVCTGFPKNLDIINDHNEIYKILYEKYPSHFNEYSLNFYNVLTDFKEKYDNGIIKEIASLLTDSHRKITLNEDSVPKLTETKNSAERLLKILDEFLFENKFECNKLFTYVKQFIQNDLFRTNEYNRIKTVLHLNYEELTIVSKDNTKLDCLLIKPNEESNSLKKNLIIICGPNLTGMEHLFRSWDLDELYLAQNCDILFWNYRGYGWSEGSATFSNVKQDIEAVYDYIKQHKSYSKIGVHGLSVGGVAACHLSTVRNIDLLVGDRTFGSVYGTVNAIKGGKYLMYLAKILCIENADNASNFIEAKCLKIVMNDPEDNTVYDKISLKTEISKKLVKKIFGSNIEYMTNVEHQSENVLHYIFTIEQRRSFYDDLFYLFDFLQTSENGNMQVLLDKKGKKYNYITTSINKDKEHCDEKVIKLTSPENIGEISMKKVVDIFYYNIKSSFEFIKSCGETLYDIRLDKSSGARRLHLNNFINNLFIFGVNDEDKKDIMICSYELNDRVFSHAIQNLEQVINNADVKQYHEFVLYDKVSKCVETLKKIKYFISEHKDEVCNDMIENQKGVLVPLYSGHIAFYDSTELDTIKYWVNNGFFV